MDTHDHRNGQATLFQENDEFQHPARMLQLGADDGYGQPCGIHHCRQIRKKKAQPQTNLIA